MDTRRGTLSFIELPVDTGRRGYMICVPINIGCCWAGVAGGLGPPVTLDGCLAKPAGLGHGLARGPLGRIVGLLVPLLAMPFPRSVLADWMMRALPERYQARGLPLLHLPGKMQQR